MDRIIFQLSNDCVKLKVSFQVNQDQGFYEGIEGPACIDSWKFLNIVEDHKIHKVSESVGNPEILGLTVIEAMTSLKVINVIQTYGDLKFLLSFGDQVQLRWNTHITMHNRPY